MSQDCGSQTGMQAVALQQLAGWHSESVTHWQAPQSEGQSVQPSVGLQAPSPQTAWKPQEYGEALIPTSRGPAWDGAPES